MTYHLLIADDDGVCLVIARVATQLYPTVTLSSVLDGAQALAAFHAHLPNLVITDLHMPGMDGLALVRAIRDLTSTVPILMLSSDWEAKADALAAGATCFLEKPFTIAALRQTLNELL